VSNGNVRHARTTACCISTNNQEYEDENIQIEHFFPMAPSKGIEHQHETCEVNINIQEALQEIEVRLSSQYKKV
jgi:hypothetical protein